MLRYVPFAPYADREIVHVAMAEDAVLRRLSQKENSAVANPTALAEGKEITWWRLSLRLKNVRNRTMRAMRTIFSTGKAAAYLGVSVKTLQRWDREDRLTPERTSTGRRSYSKAMLDTFMRRSPSAERAAVAYCRVSSAAQKPDLKNQRRVLEDFCAARAVANVEFIEEVGGGLNLKRPKFVALMDRIEARQVSHLVIAHKDRLVRFGFQWFERFCAEHGTELLVLNNEQLSPEQEMVQDLLTIVHCFSARLYGLRNYRKKLKEALAEDLK